MVLSLVKFKKGVNTMKIPHDFRDLEIITTEDEEEAIDKDLQEFPLTLEKIKKTIEIINFYDKVKDNPEKAHPFEDNLMKSFIRFLASHKNPYRILAKEICKVLDDEKNLRWFA
jgi:hypothetical protein